MKRIALTVVFFLMATAVAISQEIPEKPQVNFYPPYYSWEHGQYVLEVDATADYRMLWSLVVLDGKIPVQWIDPQDTYPFPLSIDSAKSAIRDFIIMEHPGEHVVCLYLSTMHGTYTSEYQVDIPKIARFWVREVCLQEDFVLLRFGLNFTGPPTETVTVVFPIGVDTYFFPELAVEDGYLIEAPVPLSLYELLFQQQFVETVMIAEVGDSQEREKQILTFQYPPLEDIFLCQ